MNPAGSATSSARWTLRPLLAADLDADARDRILVAAAAGTGPRVHELVALDWVQLVSDAGAVRHRVHLRAEDAQGNLGGHVMLNEAQRWRVSHSGELVNDRTRLPRPSCPPPDQHVHPR